MTRDIASLEIRDRRADNGTDQLAHFAGAVQAAERLGHHVDVRVIRTPSKEVVSIVASAEETP